MNDPRSAVADADRARLDAKTKPRGSLGRLEDLAVRIAEIRGSATPGRSDFEERSGCEKPADRLLRRSKHVHAGDNAVAQANKRLAVSDVAGGRLS